MFHSAGKANDKFYYVRFVDGHVSLVDEKFQLLVYHFLDLCNEKSREALNLTWEKIALFLSSYFQTLIAEHHVRHLHQKLSEERSSFNKTSALANEKSVFLNTPSIYFRNIAD